MAKTDVLFRTAAEWAEVNPVLGAGQVGKEKFTKKFKVGDGLTAWNDLQYEISRRELPDLVNPLLAELVIDGGAP